MSATSDSPTRASKASTGETLSTSTRSRACSQTKSSLSVSMIRDATPTGTKWKLASSMTVLACSDSPLTSHEGSSRCPSNTITNRKWATSSKAQSTTFSARSIASRRQASTRQPTRITTRLFTREIVPARAIGPLWMTNNSSKTTRRLFRRKERQIFHQP